MTQSIPASQLVTVNPGVVSAGAATLQLNGVMLSENASVPTGSVLSFSSAAQVGAYLGLASTEYSLAQNYFNADDIKTQVPATLYIAPYHASAVGAFLQGGSQPTLTLAQLQAFPSGTLTITISGTSTTSSTITLSGATSFSNAASLIAAAFSGSVVTCAWSSTLSAFVITTVATGATATLTFASTGTLATDLALTAATGAVLSQGAAADTEATAMANVVANTQNWATFGTAWEPNLTSKTNFAIWVNAQNSRYAYVAWDTDSQAIVANSTSCFGYVKTQANYNGVMVVSGNAAAATAQGTTLAAIASATAFFVMGTVAATNFSATNGRTSLAYRTQSGLLASVQDLTSYLNLIANGYCCYGAFATATASFTNFQNGQIGGKWLWLDALVDSIYMSALFQTTLLTLLIALPSLPYNTNGYSAIRSALLPNIKSMIDFGAIRTGITLSATEILAINTAAGFNVSNSVSANGYYLQILDPGPSARAARTSPIINLWYTDGGSIQQITLNSFDVQ